MENPKIRFKGFTKDGNSVSWGNLGQSRHANEFLKIKHRKRGTFLFLRMELLD